MKRSYDVIDCILFIAESFLLGILTTFSGSYLIKYFSSTYHNVHDLFSGIFYGIYAILLLFLILNSLFSGKKTENEDSTQKKEQPWSKRFKMKRELLYP